MTEWPLWKVFLVDHFWWTFVNGFCVSFTLPAVLLVLGLVLANRAGRGVGIPLLLWVPGPDGGRGWRQFAIGLGIGVLVWQVIMAGYLSEEFTTNWTWDHPPFCEVRAPYANGLDEPPFPGRFRYRPTDVVAVWRYALVVVAALTATLVTGVLGVGLLQATIGRTYAPFTGPWVPHARPRDIPRPPFSPWLPLGAVAGLALMTALGWAFMEGPGRPLAARIGEDLLWSGGHGVAAGRHERVKLVILAREHRLAAPSPAVLDRAAVAERESVRTWLRPYDPVFGFFVLTFIGATVATTVLGAINRWVSLLSPAGWLLYVLHLPVAGTIVVGLFIPFTAQFAALALLGLAIAAGRAYKLRFPNLPFGAAPVDLVAAYKRMAAEEAAETGAAVRSTEIVYARRDDLGPLKPPLALVCVSGGGSRAAAWTMSVLARLEEAFLAPGPGRVPVAFPYHVRLMTGASGGMLAAAAYTAGLDAPPGGGVPGGPPPRSVNRYVPPGAGAEFGLAALERACRANFLDAPANRLGFADLWSVFAPFRLRYDRGWALEEAWREAFGGLLDRTFDDLCPGERAGWRPSLIFSPMLVEDGRQLFVSNLSLRRVTRNLARALDPEASADAAGKDDLALLSREGVEFFELFPSARPAFQVGTAARMSASFPFLMPAVPLPTNPPRRVVDAGYYDNYGVGIATDWLATHLDWVRANTSGVVLIQIRDGESEASRRREDAPDAFPGLIDRGLQWLTSPPEGLWEARMASNTFRNDSLIHLVTQLVRSRGFAPDFFTTATFEFDRGDDVSLSFTLTPQEREWLAAGTERVAPRVRAVVDWWHTRLASPEARP